MNLNDLEFAQLTVIIHKEASKLDELARDKKVRALGDALANLEAAARKAQWRLLELE